MPVEINAVGPAPMRDLKVSELLFLLVLFLLLRRSCWSVFAIAGIHRRSVRSIS